jgi:integrase/recombinase XerC
MEFARTYNPDEKNTIPVEKKRKLKTNEEHKKSVYPSYINEFEIYLTHLNYAETSIEAHRKRGRKFCRKLEEITGIEFLTLQDCKIITSDMVSKYEQHLLNKIRDKSLKPYSAYCDLKTVRLFLKFLHFKKVINYKYEIPKSMIEPTKRLNLYVESKDIIQLAESILNQEKQFFKYRNLALLLLLVETGCRLVEASSILISDIKFTEKKIQLTSVKSGTRTLQLNDFVLDVLKKYFKIRERVNPKSDHFFLRSDGRKTHLYSLSNFLHVENIRAFGYVKVNARALRHTFITNAIDDNNDIVNLSSTMGHKHWVSTMHYLHRDKNRLLNNTLPYDPIPENFIEEGD